MYAAWAVRPGVDLGPVLEALQEAKRRGIENVGSIAAREAPHLQLDAGFCRRYLANIIRFDLGPRELEGLQRFGLWAGELGLCPAKPRVEFYREAAVAF